MLDIGKIIHMDKDITKKNDSEENSPLLTKITNGKEYYKSLRNATEDPCRVLRFEGNRSSQAGTRQSGLEEPGSAQEGRGKSAREGVLASWDSCSASPQTQWLNTTESYCLTILEAQSLEISVRDQMEV